MNYEELDPVGHEYEGCHNGASSWTNQNYLIRRVRLRFEKSSPRWRMWGRNLKSYLIEFFLTLLEFR